MNYERISVTGIKGMLKKRAISGTMGTPVRTILRPSLAIKKAVPGGKAIFDGKLPADVIARYDAYELYDILYGGSTDYWQNAVFAEMAKKEDEYIDELTSQINVEESIYVCPSCGYHRIQVSQMQSRSADESATTRYRCISCGHQWAYSS